MLRNKKGVLAILAVMGIAAVITVVVLSQADPYKLTASIGTRPTMLLQAYSYGEFTRNYLEDSAELSIYATASELAQSGGFSEESSCGVTENGVAFWKKAGSTCSPDIEESFRMSFQKYFDNYMKGYPILPYTTTNEGSIYIILYYDYTIKLNPLSVKAYPQKETFSTLDYIDENDKEVYKDVEYKHSIKIDALGSGFSYETDSYVSAETDINFLSLINELSQSSNSLNLDCIKNENCDLGLSDFDFTKNYLDTYGDSEKDVVEFTATPKDIDGLPLHTGTDLEYSPLEFKFALSN